MNLRHLWHYRIASNRRDRAQVAAALNLLATPGLGSWAAGHRRVGGAQMLLAFTGFTLFLIYFCQLTVRTWNVLTGDVSLEIQTSGRWQIALALFGVAWLWSAYTSFQIWREPLTSLHPPPPPAPPFLE
jgi:hypothetical protein